MTMMYGVIKWFDADRLGYGFIQRDDNQPDVFLPLRTVVASGFDTVIQGQRVKFECEPGRNGKGLAATVIQAAD
jgi:cold shock protein